MLLSALLSFNIITNNLASNISVQGSRNLSLESKKSQIPKKCLKNTFLKLSKTENDYCDPACTDRKALETSGSCGDHASYSIKSNILYIQGYGDMTIYRYPARVPWVSAKPEITSISISSQITSIGNNSFRDIIKITALEIPSSVRKIGQDAVRGCINLKAITFPSSVELSGDGSFWNCTSLTSITINIGTKTIEGDAFRDCTSLKSIIIPASVTKVKEYSFFHCYVLESFTYLGLSDPGPDSIRVFNKCPFTNVLVPSGYSSETFCGKTVLKPERTPMIKSVFLSTPIITHPFKTPIIAYIIIGTLIIAITY